MTAKPAVATAQLDIRPMTGALGAEILGVDVKALDDAAFADIHQAFLDYSVLVFRDQELTEQEFADFGRRFGKLEEEPFLPNKSETPGVYYFFGAPKNADKLSTQKLGWHMDHSYQKNPSLGAMLYALDVPAVGGDTLFASNYESYEALSPTMQAMLEDKIAIHDVLQYGLNSGHHSIGTTKAIEMLASMRKKFPQTEHPLVCKHPETGRKMLYINKAWTTAIKDLQPHESKALLDMLKEHSLQDVFQCRVRWHNKSLLLWDNRCVQHSPNSDYTEARRMLRLALHSDWVPGT
ncbi:MAG: taurine dioxygenase [Gammaproteobacteria bacterium]|nr:TauD/TfdA family dioxygenase [Gammaproteobacteria bacterium]NND54842.1 taurine dioxygenase [Gammaproteobacteria bacterium]